jgi:hypothetical protein
MLSLSLVACKTFPFSVDRDGIYLVNNPTSPDDMLPSLKRLRGKTIRVDSFKMANSTVVSVSCFTDRLILMPPTGKTFEQYIQDAFADELSVIEAVSENATLSISGQIQEIAFANSEKSEDCAWNIGLQFISSNGKTLQIKDSFQLYGAKRNVQMAQVPNLIDTFEHALRRTMRTTIAHPDFPSLFENPKK